MVRNKYISPLCELSPVEQESLLCTSYTTGDRGIDSLTDASGDWDIVG